MTNVTEYLQANGKYKKGIIQNFLRMQRVRYLLAAGEQVQTMPGRYHGHTLFSDHLFHIFELWLERKPIPSLNRKEYEVGWFISELFSGDVVAQHHVGSYIYDWYVPSRNLLIEFHERDHRRHAAIKKRDRRKQRPNLFVIHEATVMQDLARLAKRVSSPVR